MKRKTLILIDSYALIYRAYYAYPPTLTLEDGTQINAVYGFANLLLEVLTKFNPDCVIAVFDTPKPVLRQSDFTQYKANRSSMDEELSTQIPIVRDLVEAFSIPVLSVDGFEADDVIGTIDKKYGGKDFETIIVTGDQDLFQLVDEDTSVYLAGSNFFKSRLFAPHDVKEKLGIMPNQVTDFKAIAGDASDNIPGVRGIGKLGAAKLINDFGDLDAIYKSIEEIKGATKTKLQESYEIAYKSKELATIITDAPVSFDFDHQMFEKFDLGKAHQKLTEFKFKSLITKLEKLGKQLGVKANLTLGDSEDAKTVVNYKVGKSSDYEPKSDEIFFSAQYENLDKSPIHWKIKSLTILNNLTLYNFEGDEALSLITGLLRDKTFISFYLKPFLHSLTNAKIDFVPKYYDVGFLGFLGGGGLISFKVESLARLFGKSDWESASAVLDLIKYAYGERFTKIKEHSKLEKLLEKELELLWTVVKMEQSGFSLDTKLVKEYENLLSEKRAEIKEAIFKEIGHEININSPKQISQVLFEERSLMPLKKTKGGSFSTNESVLRGLIGTDPLIELILKFREVDKILSTYLTTLPNYVDSDGRIHAIFDQLGAVSGRFSSKNPNLQNIPTSEYVDINIRKPFIAGPDSILISMDYSQQELRLLAAMSGEEKLVESFNSGIDVHRLTASQIFGKDIKDVTDKERGIGKTINFSVVYGISAFGLSERMGLDRSTSQEFIDNYYKTYPKIKEFFEEAKVQISKMKYTETALGRVRRFSGEVTNRFAKMAIERELINFIIQGTAADIMKLSMLEIGKLIEGTNIKMIAQVHDEFVFEYKDKEIRSQVENSKNITNKDFLQFIKDAKSIMENSFKLGVEYDVDVEIGLDWANLKSIDLRSV